MEIRLNYEKNIYKNLEKLYSKIKKLRKKKESAKEALKKLEKKEKKEKQIKKSSREKEWYEKFYWFYTSEGKLAIGGRNKEQNEVLFKEHFEANDLFFHADIIGASVVILKNGKNASEVELIETAQFAVAYSKAWKEGYSRLNGYCVEKEGVTKSHKGKKADPGSFFIIGERRWFKNLLLNIRIGVAEGRVYAVPSFSKKHFEREVEVKPGRIKKEAAASEIAKFLKAEKEEVLNLLPSGRMNIRKIR